MFLKISAVYSAQENDVLHNKTCGKSDTGHVFFFSFIKQRLENSWSNFN